MTRPPLPRINYTAYAAPQALTIQDLARRWENHGEDFPLNGDATTLREAAQRGAWAVLGGRWHGSRVRVPQDRTWPLVVPKASAREWDPRDLPEFTTYTPARLSDGRAILASDDMRERWERGEYPDARLMAH